MDNIDMKIKVYIITYKKNEILNNNLRTLFSNTKKPEELEITVLANHPDIVIDKENQRKNIRVVMNTTRMPKAWGHLSQDWNFALLDGFKTADNPDNIDWVVLAQNDVEWLDGWDEWLRENKQYDFISQPRGDQSMAFTIDAVRNIGFFDENFSTLCFQEIDYFIRANLKYAERSSINDDHELHNFTINPVGEVLTKTTSTGENEDQTIHNSANWKDSLDYINSKYETNIINLTVDRIKDIKNYKGEHNFYPFFWHATKFDYCSLFKKYAYKKNRSLSEHLCSIFYFIKKAKRK